MARSTLPRPPRHLSREVAQWWRTVTADYDLEPHHLRLLRAACEAWDRMQQAREEVAAHGSLTVTTSRGDLKPHPSLGVERDCRLQFARLVRELDLDAGAPSEGRRPPPLASNRG